MKRLFEYSKDTNTKYPFVPGWEGAGTVVQSGGGLMSWRLVGKRVAVSKC